MTYIVMAGLVPAIHDLKGGRKAALFRSRRSLYNYQMSATIVSILFTFILITVLGGIFARDLQHRTWIRQQQFTSQEKRIAELKSIFVDLDATLSRRLYRTRRLLYALRRYSEARLTLALQQYDVACTRFRRHRVWCFDGTGGASWRGGSLHASSSLRRCG